MDRRLFIKAAAVVGLVSALPSIAFSNTQPTNPEIVTTQVEILAVPEYGKLLRGLAHFEHDPSIQVFFTVSLLGEGTTEEAFVGAEPHIRRKLVCLHKGNT